VVNVLDNGPASLPVGEAHFVQTDGLSMSRRRTLKPVVSQVGRPLYKTVQETLSHAIKRGQFPPGSRLPSTKELSHQLGVSLVTTHRALQEMVAGGLLERVQGRGTFVMERGERPAARLSVGVVFHREASLADLQHGEVLEGIRRAAEERGVDLLITMFEQTRPDICRGLLLVRPSGQQYERIKAMTRGRVPLVTVGSPAPEPDVASINVDPLELARLAVQHLLQLGHRRVLLVDGGAQWFNGGSHRHGFEQACDRLEIAPASRPIVEAEGWQLNMSERMAVSRLLSTSNRPTAVLAGSAYLAHNLYSVAATLGLRIPRDLSVVGVDDPPSAQHVAPPMTTLRRPLIQMGHAALSAIAEHLRNRDEPIRSQLLTPELRIRESSASAPHVH
jgi:DNA-binding LacI/PurR family transcriptional regulator